MKKLYILTAPFFLFLLLPFVSSAYFTTEQKSIDVGNGTGLFLVEYKFGVAKHSLHMPLFAEFNGKAGDERLSYQILDGQNNPVQGTAVGIVLSDAEIDLDGVYEVPAGTSKTFKLAVFFTPPENEPLEKYKLQVTHLPFSFVGSQDLELNPSELQYYVTPKLKL